MNHWCLHITDTTNENLHDALQRCFNESDLPLIVDLNDLDYINSAGIAILLDSWREYEDRGCTLLLAQPQEAVYRLFELTGVTTVIPIYATVEEALEALTKE